MSTSPNDPGPGTIDAVSSYADWQDTVNSDNKEHDMTRWIPVSGRVPQYLKARNLSTQKQFDGGRDDGYNGQARWNVSLDGNIIGVVYRNDNRTGLRLFSCRPAERGAEHIRCDSLRDCAFTLCETH